jgi:hypothetical protein
VTGPLSGDRLLAHGIGGAQDLPIPTELAIAGAVAALTVSFTVLAVAWRTPRYDEATSGRPAPRWLAGIIDSPVSATAARVVGLLLFLFTAWTAVLGEDLLINPFFGLVYVLLWVGLVPASLLLGPAWKAISPVRTLNRGLAGLTGSDPRRGLLTYPDPLGYWPAALGLFAFVWLELVATSSTELGTVRLWCAVYVAVMLLGGVLFGDDFYAGADPFEVYSSLAAKLSIWGRRDGVLVIRSPLANLDTVRVRPGLVAVVAVLFGSTAFDSFQDSSQWVRFVQSHSDQAFLLQNLGLLGFSVGVGLVFAAGSAATGVGPEQDRRALPDLFAHSVVPIIVGYIVAHYLTYLVETGQQTLILMSDPMSDGSNLFGTADLAVNYWLSYHPTFLAVTKVVAVVTGHVLGVVAAHDRAVKLLPARHQVTGQLSLLLAMVTFTVGGLYLLFSS